METICNLCFPPPSDIHALHSDTCDSTATPMNLSLLFLEVACDGLMDLNKVCIYTSQSTSPCCQMVVGKMWVHTELNGFNGAPCWLVLVVKAGVQYEQDEMWERGVNEWHHMLPFSLFIVSCFTFAMTKWGKNIYFEKESGDESGLSASSCLMHCTCLPFSTRTNPLSVSLSVHEWKTEHSWRQ